MECMIKTKRLVLRPLCLDDLYTTHAYAGDVENTKYMLFLPNKSLEETRTFLRSAQEEWAKELPRYWEFAIEFEGRHIGAIGLSLLDNEKEGELGWVIHRDYWGRGIVTEAALAVKEYAGQLGLRKLIAQCDCRNEGSYRVMEKIGMTLESDKGERRDKETGTMVKEYLYSLAMEENT